MILFNGSNFIFYLMVKHLSKKFKEKEFNILDENTKKYISFSVELKKTEDKQTY